MRRFDTSPASHRQDGFTLIELLVAILVSVALIVGMLNLFDLSNRIALEQTEIAEMQQSHRVAQYDIVRIARETARGMVPVDHPDNPMGAITIPNGLAVAVRNNVGAGENLVPGNPGTPLLVEGSDALTLRGIFSNPIYLIDYGNVNNVFVDPAQTFGTINIDQVYQGTLQQDLDKLRDAIASPELEALFVVGPRSDASFSIVELDPGTTQDNGTQITLGFRITGGTRTADYQNLAPWPAEGLRNIAYVGVLEEYQYYVQEQRRIDGDNTSPLMPRLARARFYPGTTVPYSNDQTELQVAIADNVFDLQLAMGIDSTLPLDGIATENDPADDVDDWLYNADTDDDTDTAKWVRELVNGDWERKPLFYLRINTLVHTDRKFRDYFAEPLTTIEDRTYTTADFNETEELRYRRRWLQSTVDFRNLF